MANEYTLNIEGCATVETAMRMATSKVRESEYQDNDTPPYDMPFSHATIKLVTVEQEINIHDNDDPIPTFVFEVSRR